MSLRVAIQMDPLETVDIDADTTFALMEAAQNIGASLKHPAPGPVSGSNGISGLTVINMDPCDKEK